MTSFENYTTSTWLNNISENDIIDVLDKGTSENYLPQWMSGKIKTITYKINKNEELIPATILIHYIGWSDKWDEWFDCKNINYLNRLSPRHTKCTDLSNCLNLNSFIDVKLDKKFVKNKFVCDKYSCTSCIKDKTICDTNQISLNSYNVWRIGKIIYKDNKSVLVYIPPTHICYNKHKYLCKSPIIISYPLTSDCIQHLNTHTSRHCKNTFCKGCEYPIKSLTNVPWLSVMRNVLDTYFKKFPMSFDIDKKYTEKHCPVCWTDFDEEINQIWFGCGHTMCSLCLNELHDKITTQELKCVYCRKNVFEFDSSLYSCYEFENINFYIHQILSIYNKYYIVDYNYNIQTEIKIKYIICINTNTNDFNDKSFKKYLFAQFGSKKYKDRLKIIEAHPYLNESQQLIIN